MRLLLGFYGENAAKYKGIATRYLDKNTVDNGKGIILNINGGRIKYPPLINVGNKCLLMNGVFILKDYSLDEFMNSPSAIMRSILEKGVEDIPNCFVNGAYSGVIIRGDSINLFDDFMALQPLYYCLKNDTLIFSTSLNLLAKILKPDVNNEAVTEFIETGYNFTYKTILSGISCLPPASMLKFRNGNIRIESYITFPTDREVNANQQEVIEEVKFRIKQSIKRLYSPKLSYCLSLTGGMDSRHIFLEWPNRQELLTETAGEHTSDYIKAKALVNKLGNPELHELEDLKDELYFDGIRKYYDLCDNPAKLMDDFNYYHLLWKKNRGADIRQTGAAIGELYNGENLYLSRKPISVLKEAILPYRYHKLSDSSKEELIDGVLYMRYKRSLLSLLNPDTSIGRANVKEQIVSKLDSFLGKPYFSETYVERFRTFLVANMAYYPASIVSDSDSFPILPFNDWELIRSICKFHPATRELRKLQISLLRMYKEALSIPIDTTHLKVSRPYPIQKFMRVLRMVLNIGFHKKIPLIQKGDPPKFRAYKYFDHNMVDFREYIKSVILECPIYDRKKLEQYFQKIDNISRFTFYTHHNEAANISILFRLAMAIKKLA